MSHTTRQERGGIPVFLAFIAVMVGLSILTFRSMLVSNYTATAYLRIDREAVDGTASDFMIFKETHAKLLKSQLVLKTAIRSEDLSQSDVTVQELAASLQVVVDEDELLCLQLPVQGRSHAETVATLNAVLDAYQTEVTDEERTEKVEQLVKVRKRYQKIYDEIVGETNAIKVVAERLGVVDSEVLDEQLQLYQDELREKQLQLEELRGTKEKTARVKEQVESVTESIEKKKSQVEMFESSMAELGAYRKSLMALTQDLELVRNEQENLESDIESASPVQIIQPAIVSRN